ncbi:MAG TPA: PspA/IM30 family protein, partial [Geminicoccaceae bacterium]|nr:PspA/IM30 family protein [Geminicoccaceae bacterium]
MSIFSRLTDIINSNLNAVLARAEDPEKMIRLMVQEMEDTLVEVRAAAARIIADRKTAERQLARLGEAQAEWQRRAELALTKDREDLAKGALLEKAKLAEAAKGLREELVYLDDALARYDEDIAKLEDKLREAKAKQKALVARHATATQRLRVRQQVHDRRIDD